jgi:hypothetical protein
MKRRRSLIELLAELAPSKRHSSRVRYFELEATAGPQSYYGAVENWERGVSVMVRAPATVVGSSGGIAPDAEEDCEVFGAGFMPARVLQVRARCYRTAC